MTDATVSGPAEVGASNLNRGILAVLAITILILLVVMWVQAPNFYRINNLLNILVQSSIIGVLAVGLTFVLVTGGIDLSMPSALALGGVLGTMLMRDTQIALLGPLTMLSVGALIGTFNGYAVAYLRMAPFVVTLATMTVVGGAAVWITGSQSVTGYPLVFEDAMLFRILGLPLSVWAFAAVTFVATVTLDRTVFGRFLRAAGFNSVAAAIARVPVERVTWLAYVIAGSLAGLTAMFLVARLGSASANLASDSMLLDIISACVIGRVSIYGGIGSPLQAALGAIAVTLIGNCLNQLGVSYFASLMIKGVIIVVFVYLDRMVRKSA